MKWQAVADLSQKCVEQIGGDGSWASRVIDGMAQICGDSAVSLVLTTIKLLVGA